MAQLVFQGPTPKGGTTPGTGLGAGLSAIMDEINKRSEAKKQANISAALEGTLAGTSPFDDIVPEAGRPVGGAPGVAPKPFEGTESIEFMKLPPKQQVFKRLEMSGVELNPKLVEDISKLFPEKDPINLPGPNRLIDAKNFETLVEAVPKDANRINVNPGQVVIDNDGKVIFIAPGKATTAERPLILSPGQTAIDLKGKVIFKAPEKIEEPKSDILDDTGALKNTTVRTILQLAKSTLFESILDPSGELRLLNPDDGPNLQAVVDRAGQLLRSGDELSIETAVTRAGRDSGIAVKELSLKQPNEVSPSAGVSGGALISLPPPELVKRFAASGLQKRGWTLGNYTVGEGAEVLSRKGQIVGIFE